MILLKGFWPLCNVTRSSVLVGVGIPRLPPHFIIIFIIIAIITNFIVNIMFVIFIITRIFYQEQFTVLMR